jgi:hypothetical protein
LDTPANVEVLLACGVLTNMPKNDGVVAAGVQLAEIVVGVQLADVEALLA